MGRLPLHYVALGQDDKHGLAILTAILAAYPRAVRWKDVDGRVPLHYAAQHQRGEHGVAIVGAILKAYPQGARQKERNECLPLHYAAQHQTGECGLTIVASILAAYAQAAQLKNKDGSLPLHFAATFQSGKHGFAIVQLLLAAHAFGAQQKSNDGQRPIDMAKQYNASLSTASEALLREAADGRWQPPPTPPPKLSCAYAALATESRTNKPDTTSSVTQLSLAHVRRFWCWSRVLTRYGKRNSAEPLVGLAAAASALSAENGLHTAAATLLQAGPLLYELLTAAQTPHVSLPSVDSLHALITAAEDAFAQLRTCHGAIMAAVSVRPPPKALDDTLIAARSAALAAAQAATVAITSTLLENDMADTTAAGAMPATDKVSALLRKVRDATGLVAAAAVLDNTGSASLAGTTTPSADETAETLKMALIRLDGLTTGVATGIDRLSQLDPATFVSLRDHATYRTRRAVETLQNVTHDLLLNTSKTSLHHYLAIEAPWQLAYSALADRRCMSATEVDAVQGMVALATRLCSELAVWTAAFAERDDKIERLEQAHQAYRWARKAMHRAKADDDSESESNEEGGSNGESNVMCAVKRACRQTSLERDAAAQDLFMLALAYYPEVLVTCRKRLTPGGMPSIVSQRSRDDYDGIQPLVRAGEGRHTLLQANFAGVDCVLKVVPVTDGQSLAHEAGILKQVEHPNIIKLLAVFVENDNAYLHMPYARHGDLERFLTVEVATVATTGNTFIPTAVLPVRQVQRMSRQLCEAVAYLAERSIVHCDIKPANVFVDGDRDDDTLHVVLGDFDVSHSATGRTTTLTRAVSGIATHYTPGFAPPEVLHAPAGHPPRVSPAIDVYGLGCVIFAMHMFPRKLPEPCSIHESVASNEALFSPQWLGYAATPAIAAWAASVPTSVIQAATCSQPQARSSARELLHTRYMVEASGSFAHVAIQRPAYWLHQTHMGSWLEDEPEAVRVAVENMFNASAEPSTHGIGRDSHREPFQHFNVTRVRRLEHPAVWSSYAAQRRQLADNLTAEGYAPPGGIRPLATETGGFVYPLEGGSLDKAAGEVFLFHGPSRPKSIANSGFDVRYAYANVGAGAMFGRGVYFSESASKADQYIGRDGTRPLTMVVARVLLGRTAKVTATRKNEPFLPEVKGKSKLAVPVYYDSIVADMRPQGLRFREMLVGEGSRAYPELFVEYERV